MKTLFDWGSHIVALLGILGCVIAGLFSLTGGTSLAGYDIDTIFMLGIGGMVMACLLRLYYMSWNVTR